MREGAKPTLKTFLSFFAWQQVFDIARRIQVSDFFLKIASINLNIDSKMILSTKL